MSHISNVDSFHALTEAETAEMEDAEAVEGKTCIYEIFFSYTHTLCFLRVFFFHVSIVAVEVVTDKQLISCVTVYSSF